MLTTVIYFKDFDGIENGWYFMPYFSDTPRGPFETEEDAIAAEDINRTANLNLIVSGAGYADWE